LEIYLMKLFRLGSCLALLLTAVACAQTPQAVTAPSASVGGSLANAADGSSLKVTAPATVSPMDGVRAEDRRPTLVWLNSTGRYGNVGVAYDIELSNPAEVVYARTVGESPDVGAHLIDYELAYDTVYSWRIRAHLSNDVGPWSSWASFMSPTRPVVVTPPPGGGGGAAGGGCAAPISPLGAGETRKGRPNGSAVARDIAARFPTAFAHSCQEHYGAAGWEYMDRTVDALRMTDGRYGYNAKRGNMGDPSQDVVSYFYANGDNINNRHEVYIFDIILGHCGSNPSSGWGDVTDITNSSGTIGRTMYPRPGRTVAACTPAAATAGQ
jgi:hypothetical protein